MPALMIMAEDDVVLAPAMTEGMERFVPDLEKMLIRRLRPLDPAGKARRNKCRR